jgi:hypothetical protein
LRLQSVYRKADFLAIGTVAASRASMPSGRRAFRSNDLSRLDRKPPGRKRISTKSDESMARLRAFSSTWGRRGVDRIGNSAPAIAGNASEMSGICRPSSLCGFQAKEPSSRVRCGVQPKRDRRQIDLLLRTEADWAPECDEIDRKSPKTLAGHGHWQESHEIRVIVAQMISEGDAANLDAVNKENDPRRRLQSGIGSKSLLDKFDQPLTRVEAVPGLGRRPSEHTAGQRPMVFPWIGHQFHRHTLLTQRPVHLL